MKAHRTKRIVFVLLEGFPLLGLAGSLEIYRHANRFSGAKHYVTQIGSLHGHEIMASNGLTIVPDLSLDDCKAPHALMLLAGFNAERLDDVKILNPLRLQARPGVLLGGISNGALVLASAGLLDGYNCTVHWEDFGSFCELFPRVKPLYQPFVRDGERVTCSGAPALSTCFWSWLRRIWGDP